MSDECYRLVVGFRSGDPMEAINLVVEKCDGAGRWPVVNVHMGPTHFRMEGSEGSSSRWNTLRAARVLDWAGV